MIPDTINGHIEEIVSGESCLALNYKIRDMEEYVTDLSGKQNPRCDGCVNSSTESVGEI